MSASIRLDSFGLFRPLSDGVWFYSLAALRDALGVNIAHDFDRMPISLKVLIENLARHEDGVTVTRDDIAALALWPDPNVRLKNELLQDREGGFTRHQPSGEIMTVFQAAERYREEGRLVIVIAGRNYGCGSSLDWAAKDTRLLGVRVVIAESFERIHHSNLVGMGVLPLQFLPGASRHTLNLTGEETFNLPDTSGALIPGSKVQLRINRRDGSHEEITLISRVDTRRETDCVRSGGVLPYVLKELVV